MVPVAKLKSVIAIVKEVQNEYLNGKIDLIAGWVKRSFQIDLDPKTLETMKNVAGRSSVTVENLLAKMLASLNDKQLAEKNLDLQSLFNRFRKYLPRLTEQDAQKIFKVLRKLAEKEIERRNRR